MSMEHQVKIERLEAQVKALEAQVAALTKKPKAAKK